MKEKSLSASICYGCLAFTIVSLVVFASVAFAERWMYQNLGLWGAYAAWIAMFILLSSTALHRLAKNCWSLAKFYGVFASAFFVYSALWIVCYFVMRNSIGEWSGSLFGCAGCALILLAFAPKHKFAEFAHIFAVLFLTNSVGYFLGRDLHQLYGNPSGMIAWGIVYGLGLGAGFGYALHQINETAPDMAKSCTNE